MKPLLIGQAPGPKTDPERPLFPFSRSSTGGRLAEIMGLSPQDYEHRFERINLLNKFPGKVGDEDRFPLGNARIAASAIRPLLRDRVVILVGRNVATAFRAEGPFYSWIDFHPTLKLAIIPHPSGRNHWYNSAENKSVASRFWIDLLNLSVPEKELLPRQLVSHIDEGMRLAAISHLPIRGS